MNRLEKKIIEQVNNLLFNDNWNRMSIYLRQKIENGIDIRIVMEKISNLPFKLSQLIIRSFQLYNVNLIFNILRGINDFGILNHLRFDYNPKDFFKSSLYYEIFIENIKDLFGPLSEPFISFIVKEFPQTLINYLKLNAEFLPGETLEIEEKILLLKELLNGYTLYGLNIRRISNFRDFLENYDLHKKKSKIPNYYLIEVSKNKEITTSYPFDFLNFSSFSETHLIYDELITKIRTNNDSNEIKYKFPIISMIVRGGLGPQGKGFSYLTPGNEVVEICSDTRENKAYILKYKKFLKNQFMNKLYNSINSWDISEEEKEEVFEFLDENIQLNIIDSSEIEYICDKIDKFFDKIALEKRNIMINESFRSSLKKDVYKILLPFKMQDQFFTRMNLIKSGEISANEVAKLVSLGSVSHYDMLVQRFFFQNLIAFLLREIQQVTKFKSQELHAVK